MDQQDQEENQQPYTLPPTPTGLTESDVRRIFSDMMSGLDTPTKVAGSYIQSANFVSGSAGWQLRPDGAEINGAVSVTSLDIPDTTTANSFHVDSSGNTWWGANVATGYTGANAHILADGSAVFKDVAIGGTTVQYVITNSGIFSYGDGSDGTATCDGSTAVAGMSRSGSTYTLTRDVYFNTLTIDSGVTVKMANYRMFCSISLTNNGTIQCDGNAGTDAVGNNGGSTAGTAGAAISAGYFLASAAGGGEGTSGSSTTHSLCGNGGSGGVGGAQTSPSHVGGSAGGGGTATAANVLLIANWHLATLLDIETGAASGTGGTKLFTSGGGGGGGGYGGNGTLGRGGGGGGAAGITAIYAKSITIGASGVISANGGNGGNGSAYGGGGGGGGAGGLVLLVYNALTNSGSITASGGTGGTGGAAGPGSPATSADVGGTGSDGSAGSIYQFQLSL